MHSSFDFSYADLIPCFHGCENEKHIKAKNAISFTLFRSPNIMKIFSSIDLRVIMLSGLPLVACAPAGIPANATSVAGTPVAENTHLIPATSPTSAYPKPTVPIGTGGGPFATVDGRLFQIQSKTQYFAGESKVQTTRQYLLTMSKA